MQLRQLLVWWSLALATALIPSGTSAARDPADLKQYQWRQRVLLLFAPAADHPAYQGLVRELQEQANGVRERHLVVLPILEQGESLSPFQEIAPAEARALRQRFAIRPGAFTVVLVGKDGGVKLQREGQVALAEIFGLIDGMPMRQQERRQQR
ncbi:MAG: DUF4174 domain-containing protein [Desulfobacca sp.]|uniref:DUF4174 domain-containing protein n=1 Tax=Desulfobacca sp. TaxID=2067990 RepID=UPI00404AAA9F